MTSYSKFFYEHLQTRTCQNFTHPETCKRHLSKSIILYLISNLKYFAPICFLSVLVDLRKLNKEKLKKTLDYYLSCSLVAFLVGYSTNVLICTFRQIFGRFCYYTFLFVPAFLGANFTYLGSKRTINLFENTIFQCLFEFFFIKRSNFISRTIADSSLMQTLIFMLCSAIILHGKQTYKTQGFWILTPNLKSQSHRNTEERKCGLHNQSTCSQYLFEGMRNYFIFGLTLDTIKMLMGIIITSHDQSSKLIGKLRNFRIRSTALLPAYIGMYRFLHCWFNRNKFCNDLWNHIISSFLAGSCYYLYRQPNLFAFSLVQAIRNLWSIFEFSNCDTKNKIVKRLLKIPYARLLYPFALGKLIHSIASQPNNVSHLGYTVVNGVGNSYLKHIGKEVDNIMKQNNFKLS